MAVHGQELGPYREREKQLSISCPNRRLRWDIPLGPNSETNNQLLQRFKTELLKIAKCHPHQTVLVFTHGMAIKTLFCELNNCDGPFNLGNCGLMHVTVDLEQETDSIRFQGLHELTP
jgi:broad specificity phosphatase PhoE